MMGRWWHKQNTQEMAIPSRAEANMIFCDSLCLAQNEDNGSPFLSLPPSRSFLGDLEPDTCLCCCFSYGLHQPLSAFSWTLLERFCFFPCLVEHVGREHNPAISGQGPR